MKVNVKTKLVTRGKTNCCGSNLNTCQQKEHAHLKYNDANLVSVSTQKHLDACVSSSKDQPFTFLKGIKISHTIIKDNIFNMKNLLSSKRFSCHTPFVLIMLLIMAFSFQSQAIDLYWIGPAGTQAFNNAANWSTTDPTTDTTAAISPPTAQDDIYFVDASFPVAGNYTINCLATQNVRHIRFQGLGSASQVRFAGNGTLNHYGDLTLINDSRLGFTYGGNIVETYNSAFSPTYRSFDLQGLTINSRITVQLPTTDTLEFVSEVVQNSYLAINYGTVILSAPMRSRLLMVNGQSNANGYLARFEGNNFPIELTGQNFGTPFYCIRIYGNGDFIDYVHLDNNEVTTFGSSTSMRLIINATTNSSVAVNLKSVTSNGASERISYTWNAGVIGRLTAGNWSGSGDAIIDTLESLDITGTNVTGNGVTGVVSLKKLIYPTPGCNEYVRYSNAIFRWYNYPASATQAGDTLRQFLLNNCESRDSNNVVFTGGNRSIILNGKDEALNDGFDFEEDRTPRDLYWIGGNGDWDDVMHWSLSSGGSPLSLGACPPTYLDNVFFDANSFSANGQTMTMTTYSECNNMTWNNLAFTDIDWLGNDPFYLYGSMILDVNMKKEVTYNGIIHLWGTSDSLFFEPGSSDARFMSAMRLAPRKDSHYDITTYAKFNDIFYGSNGNAGSPTYISFADTVEFRNMSGGSTGFQRPGVRDTLDMDKNSTKWLHTGAGTWAFRANPRILHNPDSWIVIDNPIYVYQSGSGASTNGRWPNTLIEPGGTINHRFANWTCMNFHITGQKDTTTQSVYTFMNTANSTGGINCLEFRTLDTLVREINIGKNNNALTVIDSLVFERKGSCLSKNILSGASPAQSGINIDPSKLRLEGAEIKRFNYLGSAPPWDATIQNFDGGNNANIIFGPPGSVLTYFWRKNPATNSYSGAWDLPDNWTTNPMDEFGQGVLGCAPSAADSLVIDQSSGDGAAYIIDGNVPLSCLALNADSARSGISVTGNGDLSIGGTLRLNDDIAWNWTGNIIASFTGSRNWATGNQTVLGNVLFLTGTGDILLEGSSTSRFHLNGRVDQSLGTGKLNFDGVAHASVDAWYAPGDTLIATNCNFFEVRNSYTPGFSGDVRGIRIGYFIGNNTRFFANYNGSRGHVFAGQISYAFFGGGTIYEPVAGATIIGDTLQIGGSAQINPATTVNHFIALNNNLAASISWNSESTFNETYTSYPNSTFNQRTIFNKTYLQSDRTHTFFANDTTFFLPTGDLAKIGDLSKVITFRSTSMGARAFLHKSSGGNIFICNIDARDVEADTIPNSSVFRTNNVSVLNNSPGWVVSSASPGSSITAWDRTEELMFRGDSTYINFLWDTTATGPSRVFYYVDGAGPDSLQVNDGVFSGAVLVGGFVDSSMLGQTQSKHFECPGIYIRDSVRADRDTVYLNVPPTERGLSDFNNSGQYLYKNLSTLVYMMDSVDYLTTAAFFDKTSPTDTDSLGIVTTQVLGQTAPNHTGGRYYLGRYYQMQAANNVATTVRLFFTKEEVNQMQTLAHNTATELEYLASIKLASFPNGQAFNEAMETQLPYTVGVANEVNDSTYYAEFAAPELATFAMFQSCTDTTDMQDTIFTGDSYAFNGQMLTMSGIYFDTLAQTNMCDSIIRLTLTVVNPPTITANGDDFTATPIDEATGGTTATVFANDDADGTTPATDALIDNNISITNTGGLTGVIINNDGTIAVPIGAPLGTYNVEYQICLAANNAFCDTAIAIIVVNTLNDMDNVDNTLESMAPNNGDGNGDGVQDSLQGSVASILDASGTGSYVTLEIDSSKGCLQITSMNKLSEAQVGTEDADWVYPIGMVDFTLDCLASGDTAEVTLLWHGIADVATLRKFGPSMPGLSDNTYYDQTTNTTFGMRNINGTMVPTTTYQIVDGMFGDESGTAAEIEDPVGPALPAPPPCNSSTGTIGNVRN